VSFGEEYLDSHIGSLRGLEKRSFRRVMFRILLGEWTNLMRHGFSTEAKKSAFQAVALGLVALFLVSSCTQNTAVLGIPVNEVKLPDEARAVKAVQTEKTREELAKMSEVKENDAFEEITGIPEYRIGAYDVLEISSYTGDKVKATMVTVDGRGRISYSFIDNLPVNGLTPSQLERLLITKLSAYVRNPRINVLVKEFNSKSATVIGEFSVLRTTAYGTKAASGKINLKGKTRLTDLIALGGGYTVQADIRRIQLIRKGQSYLINLYDILEKADESQNVIIDDDDVVNIPELPEYGERVYVLGEVNAQGVYPLKQAQDLLAALSLAGSYTKLAKEEDTLIVRGYEPGKPPIVMMANVKALLRKGDLSQNIRLKDGDLVYVPRMLIGDINDWIVNMTPLLNLLLYPGQFDAYYSTNKVLTIK
jgi:protein involved in polysaccharide export with SLBB domain